MRGGRRPLLGMVIVLAAACVACATPPDKEMQQAQAGIEAARRAGAERYAPDELAASLQALKRAQDAVADHDFASR